jgi:peptide/nickel transport system permease protein
VSDLVVGTPELTAVPVEERGQRRRKRDKILVVSTTICGLIILLALIGPMIAPHPPDQIDVLAANADPSGEHLFGTDSLGRDVFSRVIAGARLSVFGPALVVLFCTILGTTLAIVSAWRGGATDRIIARGLDVLFAFPALLFAIIGVAVFGQGLTAPIIALSIAYTPYIARVVRGIALRERNLPYIEACRVAGFSSWKICARHILPNVWPIIMAQATLTFGFALVDLAAISFLGLGVQPPDTEWGLMVAEGRTALLNGWPQAAFAAGGMIVLTVVSFNVLGERLARKAEGR